MRQKKGNFRKAAIAVVSSICVFTSFNAIDVKAATASNYGRTSQGYEVCSTASFSGKSITGRGSVTSGPPCSIEVYVEGYHKINGVLALSCSIRDKISEEKTFAKTTSGSYTIVKAVCQATFNSSTKVTATAK